MRHLSHTTRATNGHAWATAGDALDHARVRLLMLGALLLPYVLAGVLVGMVIATGPTTAVEPRGALWGTLGGVLVGLVAWLGRMPRVALVIAGACLVVLGLPLVYRLSW